MRVGEKGGGDIERKGGMPPRKEGYKGIILSY